MKKLNFSEEYVKLLNNPLGEVPKKATLLEAFAVGAEELHPRFVELNTLYFDKAAKNWAKAKLPQGKVIVLLLQTDIHGDYPQMIWTAIRRFTPERFEYYKKNRFQEFRIIVGGSG